MKAAFTIAAVGAVALVCFFLASSPSSVTESEFTTFMEIFGVGYSSEAEYNFRLGVFEANLQTIAELNAKVPSATFAVNKFADRTPAELNQLMAFKQPEHAQPAPQSLSQGRLMGTSVDWSGLWTETKNQGRCGSCWAFSATATFEARFALKAGQQTVTELFSEQELVDCVST